jgi:FtsP/CotA-like multicopper oxidase with cupredoxin domain
VHVHFEEDRSSSARRPAPPEWEQWARKDVYPDRAPARESAPPCDIAVRFREFAGTYMEHCHNTQHEDTSMLLRWDVERPGQFTLAHPHPGGTG